jgi:hypothetical protein
MVHCNVIFFSFLLCLLHRKRSQKKWRLERYIVYKLIIFRELIKIIRKAAALKTALLSLCGELISRW